jgi:hypothetical protein
MKAPMLLALAALSISTAQAAEPTGTLTLACNGTVTGTGTEEKPEPISMGVIVNLTTGIVQGFSVLARVTAVDDTVITFNRSNSPFLDGRIDRVTGLLQAGYLVMSGDKVTIAQNYSLKCSPARRKF